MKITFNKNSINIVLENDLLDILKLFFIKYENYSTELNELNNELLKNNSEEKSNEIKNNQVDYLNKRLVEIKVLIRKLKTENDFIKIAETTLNLRDYSKTVSDLGKLNKRLSLKNKIKKVILDNLENQILDLNEIVLNIQKFDFKNNVFEYIVGGDLKMRFNSDSIIYKNLKFFNQYNTSIVFSNDNSITARNDVKDLLNTLAFLYGKPNFILSDNRNYNSKLINLYSEFDLVELIHLSKKDFFQSKTNNLVIQSDPIFKHDKGRRTTTLPQIFKPEVLNLYHSSLKQLEPLPRCLFLWRIVEFARKHHYIKTINQNNPTWHEIIEYYYNQAIFHKFIPLFYFDNGSIMDESLNVINEYRKPNYYNLITDLKHESKKILKEWKENPFLVNKSLGAIIYDNGRNAIAHGGNETHNSNYDYANKYLHSNSVNVFLELISRYIIELFNPNLKNFIFTTKEIYLLNSSYKEWVNKK